MSWAIVLIFFFQAEDGIRDLTVTGVQTCALPISRVEGSSLIGSERISSSEQRVNEKSSVSVSVNPLTSVKKFCFIMFDMGLRSEERRVGKECRCRWSRYHGK